MNLMASRMHGLAETLAGWRRTGVPLVAWDGESLSPAGFSDDPGLYWVVPHLSDRLHLSLASAAGLFLGAVVLAAFAVGAVGCWKLFRDWPGRAAGLFLLALPAAAAFLIGDVYVFPPALALALVPWWLRLLKSPSTSSSHVFLALASGTVIGLAHWFRSHAGTAVLVFILAAAALKGWDRRRKAVLAACLLLGFLAGWAVPRGAVARRDGFLAREGVAAAAARHPFWHSVWVGFGFLANDYGFASRDEAAMSRVRVLDPGAAYLSAAYGRALRNDVLRQAAAHPFFALRTLFAKAGVTLVYFLMFANAGLWARLRRPLDPSLERPFLLALAFSALFGLLVLPNPQYLLGLMAFAALWGAACLANLRREPAAGEKS